MYVHGNICDLYIDIVRAYIIQCKKCKRMSARMISSHSVIGTNDHRHDDDDDDDIRDYYDDESIKALRVEKFKTMYKNFK